MNKYIQIILVAGLLAGHIYLGLGAIRAQSPTYDEPVHFAAGYSYLKADDYRMNTQDHPPLAKSSWPMFRANPRHTGRVQSVN